MRLKKRSGLSFEKIAAELGVKRGGLPRYFQPDYRPDGTLALPKAIEFARVFAGRGKPPITQDEVLALTGLPEVEMSDEVAAPLTLPVATAIVDVLGRIILGGQEPAPGGVVSAAQVLRDLSEVYRSAPEARGDPAQTRGVLLALTQRSG